jgi:hypothetical protein
LFLTFHSTLCFLLYDLNYLALNYPSLSLKC